MSPYKRKSLLCVMRSERSKYATEALLSFSSKVRRRATDIDHSTNYQQLMDDDDSSPLRPAGNKFVRKKSNNFRWKTIVSCADTAAERFVVHNSHTDEESRDDDHKYLLGGDEDRCQVMETFTSSSEEDKPYNHTATTKLLLLPGLVDFGGSSRQGPLTLHELGFKPFKKKVHFSTVEVKMYRWDRKYDRDVTILRRSFQTSMNDDMKTQRSFGRKDSSLDNTRRISPQHYCPLFSILTMTSTKELQAGGLSTLYTQSYGEN